MHELSVMRNILQIAVNFAKKQNADEIIRITVTAGTIVNIVPAYAKLFFKMIAKDTIAQNAVLDFNLVPAAILCSACGEKTQFEAGNMLFICPGCGSDGVQLVSGRELRVESIEII